MTFSPSFEEGDHPAERERWLYGDEEEETVETPTLTDAQLLELAEAAP